MLYGKNSKGKLVNILESHKDEKYICGVCGEELIRCFGLQKQYFSHSKDKAKECELKLKRQLELEKEELDKKAINILHEEYYCKDFGDIKVDMSDTESEEGYKLTKEQMDIINSEEDKIVINASAGASKSYTLYRYAKERPDTKFLYLVYNKAMQVEAENLFSDCPNVTVKTTHGLAYGYEGKKYRRKLTFSYKPIDVFKDLDLSDNAFELAVQVHTLLNEFMLSSKYSIDDMELYKEKIFANQKDKIYILAKKLWEMKCDTDNNIKVEHDFYLKKFHLSKKNLSKKFDCVMIDEAQDSNEMVFDMMLNMGTKGIVIVGDQFQAMYQFRKAKNIMSMLEDAKEYKLTTSFRVSQAIANISNILLSDVYGIDFGMKGFNDKNKIVDKLNEKKPYMVLARTNATLFSECINAIDSGKKKLYFEGGFNSYRFNDILDCYNFSEGDYVNNSKLNKFDNYTKMVEYAEKNEDVELLSLINAVKRYGDRIPQLISRIRKTDCPDRDKADVGFCTIHKSKGQTYENVRIMDDCFSMEDYFNKIFIEKIEDKKGSPERSNLIKSAKSEVCILYVAITRAKGQIELNDDLKRYLVLRYQYNSK